VAQIEAAWGETMVVLGYELVTPTLPEQAHQVGAHLIAASRAKQEVR